MKSQVLAALGAALLLTGCYEATLVDHRPAHRRYVAYNDRDTYRRAYYREPRGRTYDRQHYYGDDPVYRTRVDSRRHYYRRSADRGSVRFGF